MEKAIDNLLANWDTIVLLKPKSGFCDACNKQFRDLAKHEQTKTHKKRETKWQELIIQDHISTVNE